MGVTDMPRAAQGSSGILSRDPRAEERTHLLLGPPGLSAASFLVRGHMSCSSSNPHARTRCSHHRQSWGLEGDGRT